MASADGPAPQKLRFFSLLPAAFDDAVAGWGWPRFRGKQVREWAYGKLVSDASRMTNLGSRDRALLAERVEFARADITRRQDSADGTRKLLLTWSEQPGATAAAPS